MADGLGFASFLLSVSDDYDMRSLPALKPLPFWKQLFVNLAFPFITPPQCFKILTKVKDTNAIQKNQEPSGVKRGAFARDLDISKVKEYAKR